MDSSPYGLKLPPQHLPQLAGSSVTTSSPSTSVFSVRGHSSRGSGSSSSLASSPIARDSLDIFGSTKRLEDVREEPQEREDEGEGEGEGEVVDVDRDYFLDNCGPNRRRNSREHSLAGSPTSIEYSFVDYDDWSLDVPSPTQYKKLRSADTTRSSVTNRFGSRFGSLSKKWKMKSGANPQLSIITHNETSLHRSSSSPSSHLISPALSAVSQMDSRLPPSPVNTSSEEVVRDSASSPVPIEDCPSMQPEQHQHATTPLLPPVFTELSTTDTIVQSPLQSPTTAECATFPPPTTTPTETPQLRGLPSPPLSTKPSIASFKQRSRANTGVVPSAQIPELQMLDEVEDTWAQRLGHSNVIIQPEPYVPAITDMPSYTSFRADWDLARSNYLKHLTFISEHYGLTSKTYKLTQEKWNIIDAKWKGQNDVMTAILGPAHARISNGDSDTLASPTSSIVLERPLTRVEVPQINNPTGKFPQLGDDYVVGPMAVGLAQAEELQKPGPGSMARSTSTRKRSFLRFISDILARSTTSRA